MSWSISDRSERGTGEAAEIGIVEWFECSEALGLSAEQLVCKLTVMAIPAEITALIERLNQELDQTSQETTEGLNIVRSKLLRFPDNAILIQFFASLSSIRLFIDNSRGKIQNIVEQLSITNVDTDDAIQEAGEDLSTLLGLTLEAKMVVDSIKTCLES